MHPFSVNGVALITGGASGIGRDTAFSFAEAGAHGIVFADLSLPKAREAAEESKKYAINPRYRAIALEVNVTDEDSVVRMVEAAVKEFERIDYSINSAGAFNAFGSVQNLKMDEFDRIYNINVRGTAICMKAVSKQMASQEQHLVQGRNGPRSLGRGCIVNLGSVNSYIVGPKSLPYVTSKHAVIGLTKSAALDCADDGVRVNAVCPSFVSTPMTDPLTEKLPPATVKTMLGRAGRMALPEEVSGAILFLCSPAASYITGTGMIVDAGMSLPARAG